MDSTSLSMFLCQHNHQHYTLFICLSVSLSVSCLLQVLLFLWVPLYSSMFLSQHNLCCFLFNLNLCSFYGFHFTVQALVSAPPLTLHTLFMQLLISINYHSLPVCRLLQVMLFLWAPLYSSMLLCQHNHQHYTRCSFVACLLFKLCSFYRCHYYCACSCVTHTVHAAAYQYQLSFSACLLFLLMLFVWVPLYIHLCQHHH